MMPEERMWKYLHDKREVVNENLFVTDIYRYTSDFVDMLIKNPERIQFLIARMKLEQKSPLRGNKGMAELRVMKMMKVKNFSEFLSEQFGYLLGLEIQDEMEVLKRDWQRLG